MIIRALNEAKANGRATVFVDFSGLGGNNFGHILYTIAERISKQLEIGTPMEARFMSRRRSPQSAFLSFIFERVKKPIIVAFDEVDYLSSIGKLETFFSLLRAIYTQQQIDRSNAFFLVSSFRPPRHYLKDPEHSGFDFDEGIALENFTEDQASELFSKYGITISRMDFDGIMALTGGQPYLLQETARLIRRSIPVEQIIEDAPRLEGPFGMHLATIQTYIDHSPFAAMTLERVLFGRQSARPRIDHFGLTELIERGILNWRYPDPVLACDLYRQFFLKYYSKMPFSPLRKIGRWFQFARYRSLPRPPRPF